MKVLHITTSSKGGAGIAALRLHEGLTLIGVESAYLSTDKTVNFNNNEIEDSFFNYQRRSFFNKIITKVKSILNPSLSQRFSKELAKIDRDLSYEILSLPFSSFRLENHPLVKEADVINLHWISKMVDYPTFFKNINKPIVWTLHDMNPFIGIFHYQFDVSRNPKAKQLDAQISNLKKECISQIKKGAVVTPSDWLLQLEKKSNVFNHFGHHVCIHNSLGVHTKNASRENSRTKFGISKNENVLLFVAGKLDNPRKGIDILLEALQNITIPITLLTLGKGNLNAANKNVKLIPLGFMTSQEDIAACYVAADLFVLPSREDNLPNTMLESLSQGTPVISFENGGMKEIIENDKLGIIVKETSVEALTKTIETFFSEKETYKSDIIRNFAKEQFNYKKQAESYKKVYLELL